MKNHSDDFAKRLKNEWLEPFCETRSFSSQGFDPQGLRKLSPKDARDFMEAVDTGLVSHHNGSFLTAQSKAKEQIFWEGSRTTQPRKITLWQEPIITMAGMCRLSRDFHWPAQQLGLQSANWAFDLVAYDHSLTDELLLCEVKKTEREIDTLVQYMHRHSNTPNSALPETKGAERNALKKVIALRESSAKTFWALGPNSYSQVFSVSSKDGALVLTKANNSALMAPNG